MPSQTAVTARASPSLPNPKPRGLRGPRTETQRKAWTPSPNTLASKGKLRLSGDLGFRPVGVRTSRPGSVPGGSLHPSACRRLSHGLTHRRPLPEVPTEPLTTGTTTVRKPPPLQAACTSAAPPRTRASLLVARDHAYLPNRACVPASLAAWCSSEEVSFALAQVCSHLHRFALTCTSLLSPARV